MDRDTTYCLLGDSSLYTKRPNRKKSFISAVLREKYRFENLTEKVLAGGGVKEMRNWLIKEVKEGFDVMGISYFGNEHTSERMRGNPKKVGEHTTWWKEMFELLRQKVRKRVVFFVGGYAAKYSCSRVYDENMATVKKWIRDAGFQVVEAKQEVDGWALASDKLHFTVECLPELAAFWNDLLVPRKFVQPGKRLRQLQDQRSAQAPPAKRARQGVGLRGDPRDKWLLPASRRNSGRTWRGSDMDVSSDERTKCLERAAALERAARLERDKKKLNDELAMRRMKMLKSKGLLPLGPVGGVPLTPAFRAAPAVKSVAGPRIHAKDDLWG